MLVFCFFLCIFRLLHCAYILFSWYLPHDCHLSCFLHIVKVLHPVTTDENDLFATPGTIHLLSNVLAEETKYPAIARCTTMNSDYKCTTIVSNLVLCPLSAIKHNITGKNWNLSCGFFQKQLFKPRLKKLSPGTSNKQAALVRSFSSFSLMNFNI